VGSDVHWLVADARRPPLQHGVFDRVLLDAPCTGLGTLRRRPEIRHRIRPSSSAEAGLRQRAMVEAALPLLRPGGRLVYSVCTVLALETIDVVAGLGARPPDDLPGLRTGDGLLLAPHLTGTDGMFIAVIDA
jgi:16S rRNA (cytosine967-C5)-methyltransferase